MLQERKRIMVVDDDPLVADVIVELLKERYDVTAKSDGASALAASGSILPDLILLDVSMPGMDGYETCHQLKLMASTREVPVIFLTAQDSGDQVAKGFKAGGVDYVTKPFDSVALMARLETHLLLHEARTELTRVNKALRNELAWAGELQQRLLGIELPQSERINFSVVYKPLPDLHCGGDYYDVFILSADRFLVLLGDVSGHGVQAALITVMLKSIIYRGYVRGHRDRFDPGDFLSWLNEQLSARLESLPGIFVTFLAFVIDLGSMNVTFGSAGQHPPRVVRGAEVMTVSPRGPSLGILGVGNWSTESLHLAPGDRIVAFSDGLVEAGKGLDADDIAAVLRSCAAAEDYAPMVLAEAKRRSGADDFADDVTVVAARLG